jgi:hypothetical protein
VSTRIVTLTSHVVFADKADGVDMLHMGTLSECQEYMRKVTKPKGLLLHVATTRRYQNFLPRVVLCRNVCGASGNRIAVVDSRIVGAP